MKIVRLEAENVKRLSAVEITPEGELVVVGGRNGAGKTSVLDSIAYALGGKDAICEKPLRQGAEHGHVVCDLGDLIVRRTFTERGGGTLVVENKDGARYRSPQAMLDRLVGRLSFDPLAFARMEPKRQLETLKRLVGLDLSDLDAERDRYYEQRRDANREVKAAEARLAGMPHHDDAPEAEVSVADLTRELDAITEMERQAQEREAAAQRASDSYQHAQEQIKESEAEIEELERRLQGARDLYARRAEIVTERHEVWETAECAARQARQDVPDGAPVRARIESAERENRKVRENADHAEQKAALDTAKALAAASDDQIQKIDAKKAQLVAEADFPVEGLALGDDGVTFGGIPFSQASSAEQLRVSVAMGLAMNPELRVLLIRDGSLLDDENLKLMAEMAAQNDAQVWIERVGEGKEVSVLIEDGHVAGAETGVTGSDTPGESV